MGKVTEYGSIVATSVPIPASERYPCMNVMMIRGLASFRRAVNSLGRVRRVMLVLDAQMVWKTANQGPIAATP